MEKLLVDLAKYLPEWKPEYDPKISEAGFAKLLDKVGSGLAEAIKLFDAYWKSSNEMLLDLAFDSVKIANRSLSILYIILPELEALRFKNLSSFLFELAGGLGSGD